MARPVVFELNGYSMPAVPRGCTPFPAVGKYPADWTLHLLAVDADGERRHRSASGGGEAALNAYGMAAHEHGETVVAWIVTPDDMARDARRIA